MSRPVSLKHCGKINTLSSIVNEVCKFAFVEGVFVDKFVDIYFCFSLNDTSVKYMDFICPKKS